MRGGDIADLGGIMRLGPDAVVFKRCSRNLWRRRWTRSVLVSRRTGLFLGSFVDEKGRREVVTNDGGIDDGKTVGDVDKEAVGCLFDRV